LHTIVHGYLKIPVKPLFYDEKDGLAVILDDQFTSECMGDKFIAVKLQISLW